MPRFVWSALYAAIKHGAHTGLLTFNEFIKPKLALDHLILVSSGPEILTGSTRLKCGTLTKVILNMISTAAMIKLGRFDFLAFLVPKSNEDTKKSEPRSTQHIKPDNGRSRVLLVLLVLRSKFLIHQLSAWCLDVASLVPNRNGKQFFIGNFAGRSFHENQKSFDLKVSILQKF